MFFIEETEVCNFADDTAIYSCASNFEEATLKLSNDTCLILNWFRINSVRLFFLGQSLIIGKLHLR